MTASLELRIQKDIYNLAGRIRVNEASRIVQTFASLWRRASEAISGSQQIAARMP